VAGADEGMQLSNVLHRSFVIPINESHCSADLGEQAERFSIAPTMCLGVLFLRLQPSALESALLAELVGSSSRLAADVDVTERWPLAY